MIARQRILSISPFVPLPFLHGGITRIHYLNKYLAARNRLVFAHRGATANALPGFPAAALSTGSSRISQLVSPPFLHRCLRIVRRKKIDLILANHIWSGLHGMVISKLTGVPLVFDDHNVEYVRFRRSGARFWPAIRLLERAICTAAERVLCVSETDRDGLVRGLGIPDDRIQVIENGADIANLRAPLPDRAASRRKLGLAATESLLLFFGSFGYRPNVQAARIILREIHPRLVRRGRKGRILLVGAGLPALPGMARTLDTPIPVEAPGFVDDLALYIKCADVLLAPITSGSGTRLKILESLACGTPVVTTHLGAEGLDLAACGGNLSMSDDWEEFTDRLIATAHARPAPLPRAFEAKYDWRRIADRIEFPMRTTRTAREPVGV